MLSGWEDPDGPDGQYVTGAPRILVIDDSEGDCEYIRHLLSDIFESNLHLDFARTWDEAEAAVTAAAHDIYIVDYFLSPGIGLDLIEPVAKTDETRVFVMLTGSDNRDVDVAATRAGVAAYLLKTDLTAGKLERCLRYATQSMLRKRKLVEQKKALLEAKSATEKEMARQQALTEELTQSQRQLTEALERAERSEQRYRWLAQHDMPTKISNRSFFAEKLRLWLAQSTRSENGLGLFLIDASQSRRVQDTPGQQKGDELLKQFADRLTKTIRETDVVARIGEHEIAVIASNLEDEHCAAAVAEKMVAALSHPFAISGNLIESGASVGIAMSRQGVSRDPDEMIEEAGKALGRAKASGQDAFLFGDAALNDRVQRTFLLKKSLPQAIAAGEIRLAFQPKVSLSNGAVTGFEALARWSHPTLGAIAPDEFIPIAKSIGQIDPLSIWLFEQAFTVVASWNTTALEGASISLNFSTPQLEQSDLVEQLESLLDRFSLDSSILQLEITEVMAVKNSELAIRQLNKLRALGVKTSIDEFGTGQSSLALATSLPADSFKIDSSFIAGMLRNSADAAAVNATIVLARSLGIRTVAEGVETKEQLARLGQQGCDEAQGCFFMEPMLEDNILDWYRTKGGALLPAV